MSNDQQAPHGSYPTPEAGGLDRAYEAERQRAQRELAATMAGPKRALDHAPAEGAKDPEGEFEAPARRTGPRPSHQPGPGPDQAGNSSGTGPVDPQGQQGGTEGGSPSDPALPQERHPLASAEERARENTQLPAGDDKEG